MKFFCRILNYIFSLFFSRKRRLTYYGKWAVITGASDGIGKAVAQQLLKEGLSLIIIGRNKEKLSNVSDELQQKITPESNQEIKQYIVDFKNPSYYLELKDYLNKIEDIGILVNNVGVSYPFAQYFEEVSVELINELIEVNVRSVFLMTHMIYGKMKKSFAFRKKGAILCIGSGSSQLPSDPLYSAYAATKSVAESLCRSLQSECISEDITIQCHTPLLVNTKMSKVKKESFFIISPEKMAMESLNALKRQPSFYCTLSPYFGHKLQLIIANLIPVSLWNHIRLSQTKKIREKALSKNK